MSRGAGRAWRSCAASFIAAAALLAGCATPTPAPVAAPSSSPAIVVAPVPAQAASASAPAVVIVAPVPAASAIAVAPPPTEAAAGTPAAGKPLDPLKPEREVDPDDAGARGDLWQRLRKGFAIPDLDNDDYVRRAEQWYADRPDYVARMTERASRYLFHVVEEVERRGLPTELALLPFVESAFNPQALSVAKASGMWQFIPSTGKNYDLKQNLFRDDRRDVLASTRAALDYLSRLHDMFGDWQLALAAYNWGEGNVQRAIARNEKAGLPTDFASLRRMPEETRYYVPKLQAVKNIVRRPEAYALTLSPIENHPYFLSVPIERDIDIALAARLAGVPLDEFKGLNPQMNRPVILAAGTPQVLLPYDNANRFVRALGEHRGPLASWTAWVAPKTMRPAEAARATGMDEASLREVNKIPPKMLVKAGSTLLVARAAHNRQDVSEHVADNALMVLAPDLPPQRRLTFRAGKRGTTVIAVAHQYKVSAAQVAGWNSVSAQATFKAGQTIVVYVPTGSKVTVVRTAATPRSTGASSPAAASRKASGATRRPGPRGSATASTAAAARHAPGRRLAADSRDGGS